ncbi:helix-turn-helix domain-containing protein [Paenibacillus sp. KQZ6P-2]|uniref:Helix-turn-helix domain-containing protein n=1 Tax=Paenibacillus mangrovi TaxID=2931978 RepID=A0A9X1WVF7_9BACL|nr:helix-turn-helix domain-containing protein [Paenibacillus mangrovi]MCJ8014495.1 helix-turn-helix domain-containing protein [Paenibacillus mangrovi]
MNLVSFKARTSMFKKLLISFVAIITALIFVLSSMLYYNYTSSSIEMLKEMKTDILSKTSYSAVYMDTLSKKFCQSLSLNNSIIAFANSNNEDILNISKAIQTLSALAIPNTYIQSAYVYNRKIDTIIATPSNTFYSSSDFYDREIIQMLNLPQNSKTPILYPIPRRIANPEGSNTEYVNVYTYILFDTSDNRQNFNSAIVLNVDADWLRMTISSIDNKMSGDGNELLVVDKSGVIVSHSSPDMFMQQIADQGYFQKAISTKASSGTFFDHLDHKKVVVSYVSSENLGWIFLSITPYETVFSSVQRNGTITIGFCLMILLLGLFFAFLASVKLYRPIGALTKGIKQKLNQESKPENHMDEVSFLASAFNGMFDKTVILEQMKRDSTPLLKNSFLKQVLSGQVLLPSNSIAVANKELNIHLDFTNHLFMYLLKIDFYKEFTDKHNEKDRSLYKYAIANITKEITSEHFRNEVVDTASDHFVVLADLSGKPSNPEVLYSTFYTIAHKIQHQVKQYLNISLSGTLGYVIESSLEIKNIYEDTLNLSMYRIKYGHFSILTPEILQNIDSSSFYFPSAKEKQLIDLLKLGKGESAKEAYKEIITAIERSSYDNIITSTIYLFFTIYNALNHIVDGKRSKLNSISIDFLSKVNSLETLEEIEQTIFSLIDEIIVLKSDVKSRKRNEIVESVIELISENYSDKNLSLNSCAEVLSLSSVYLGKLFKNSTGKSVAEYITAVRMEKIKQYLEQSSMPINEILEKCGMEKSNYFYTSFKKYFGISLTEYRLNAVKIKDEYVP